jgi:hypothetical protein
MKKSIIPFLAMIAAGNVALGDVVYVTSNTSNCTATAVCGQGANLDLNVNGGRVFNDNALSSYTSALAGTPDKPLNAGGARFFSNSFSNTTPDLGLTISPTLGVTGGVYKVYHVYSSTANNVSTNIVVAVTNNEGCTLSFDQTDRFQRRFGQPAPQQWQLLGLLTNHADTSTPTITFYFKDGLVNAGLQNRLVVDTFRFLLYEPCTDVPVVGITGPLAASLGTVVVTGVSNAATKVTVYQDSGAGMVAIGSKTSDIVGGNNTVAVSGLVKGAQVAATQTLNGQEGCVPTGGSLVGGGANPQVRIALTVRETTNVTATVGAPGNTTSANLHFLGASTVSGGAPVDAPIIYPSNGWQTVTLSRGTELVGNPTNVVGAATTAGGYAPNDSVVAQVYAFRTVPANSTLVYSRVGGTSVAVTSNNVFGVDWTWNAVPGAEGYRLLRNMNQGGFLEGADVTGTNFFSDVNNAWFVGTTITPTMTQTNPSIQWNPTVGNQNNLPGQWGTLESINFVIDDLTDTGPYDLYLDNLQNGATVFQTFEAAPANTTDYGFRAPGFSGTTSGNILPAPNQAIVANSAADGGTKSLRVQFQWNGLTASKWLRLTTSGVLPASNPFVNLDEPISFRLLLQPVGAPAPARPPAPALSINVLNGQPVLNWEGGHRLQSSVTVTGPYTNVPQSLTATTNTYLGPYTNTFTEPERLFRLVD